MYAYNKYFDQNKHVLGSFSLQFFQNRCTTYPIVIWNENPKIEKYGRVLPLESVPDLYETWVAHWEFSTTSDGSI